MRRPLPLIRIRRCSVHGGFPMAGKEFEKSYRTGDTPWDSGVPSAELTRVLDAGLLPGKTVLEIGCGTGTNAIAFARRGYRVTAVDTSRLPCGGRGRRHGRRESRLTFASEMRRGWISVDRTMWCSTVASTTAFAMGTSRVSSRCLNASPARAHVG